MRPQDHDLQPELNAMRQRLDELESRNRELLRRLSPSRRRGFPARAIRTVIPAVVLLAVGSVLYGHAANEALFIDPRGWIGIATPSPQAVLDVNGTLRVKGPVTSEGTVDVGTAAARAALTVTGDTRLKGPVTAEGAVDIGTAAARAGLTVTGDTQLNGRVGINRTAIQDQHLVITPSQGNVALNVTDPAHTKNW